jgi:hypothetical protein
MSSLSNYLSISLVGLTPEQAQNRFRENMNHIFEHGNKLIVEVPNDFCAVAWELVGLLYDRKKGFKPNYTYTQGIQTTIFILSPPIIIH